MPTPRHAVGAAVIGDWIYVAGGGAVLGGARAVGGARGIHIWAERARARRPAILLLLSFFMDSQPTLDLLGRRRRRQRARRWPTTPSAPTSNTRCAWSRAARCPTSATARSRCSAASSTRWRAWAWASTAPAAGAEAGQERARRRRRARPLPSAQRPGGLRRAGAHGAGLLAALSADRRPGQLRHRATATAPRRCATPRRAWRRSRSLLLDEIDEGTVDFIPNYDGSTEEPRLLPARLPFVLLNGASGIAVGLATEIPSHNLREVAAACGRAAQGRRSSPTTSCSRCCPAPTIPAAARSSAAPPTSPTAYRTGRGSLKVRARWKIEDLARGQWQLVVTELPPGVEHAEGARGDRGAHQPEGHAPARRRSSAEQTQLKATRARGARRGARRVEQGRGGAPGVRAEDRAHRARTSSSPRCSRTPASKARRRST